jgi:hypothetical protein
MMTLNSGHDVSEKSFYIIFPIFFLKKNRGGLRHPWMMRLETLFRPLLDAPDRWISPDQKVIHPP